MEDQITSLTFDESFLNEFYRLYDKYFRERFQPALANLTRALTALLDDKFPTSRRMRLRVEEGRIKSPNRLLQKAESEKYRPLIRVPDDIFVVIRDIVGTRVTCNTLSDVYAVVEAIKPCATSDSLARTLCKLHDDWEDDYITKPKDTGYRALNLIVGVPVPRGGILEPVTCEIQIRTLLQHAWGELTHEDTYKPGVKVPDLVQILSKRLATTLAVLDEIAQDLRNELDKVESIEVAIGVPAETIAPATKEAISEQFPIPGPATPLQGVYEPTSPAPSPPEVPVEQVKRLSREDLLNAFRSVFDRDSTMSETGVNEILEEFHATGLSQAEEVTALLSKSHKDVQELESEYERVSLTDFGRLRAAIQFREDAEKGAAWVRNVLKQVVDNTAAKESFKAAYPEGREAFGTVVHVTWDYALVQLPEGDTGILHVTQMKNYPDEYVSVDDLIREGDTVRVRIVKTNPESKRIELQLI